ncbi:MAG: Hsp33 family molecular chaperone HslO [Firmicutes bacterium]|nr:Hsp33 family molecular chaperone HslO [Bacillota bacterium]
MMDYLIRGTAANLMVRAFAVDATETVEEARRRHDTSPVITAALGRLLAAGAMMGSAMKGEDDLLTLVIRSDGPAKGLTVTANSKGEVKGYPQVPQVEIPLKAKGKLDVGGALGPGTLTIIMDLGLKEPYSGQIELQTGEIGDDIAYYYTKSEQTPSAVGLGVMVEKDLSVKHAGGFMIQLMPDATEDVISVLETKLAKMPPITTLMEEGKTPEEILMYILEGLDPEITDKAPVCFRCNCSHDRMLQALATLKKSDIQELIDEGEDLEVVCHFCNTKYAIGIDELKEQLQER